MFFSKVREVTLRFVKSTSRETASLKPIISFFCNAADSLKFVNLQKLQLVKRALLFPLSFFLSLSVYLSRYLFFSTQLIQICLVQNFPQLRHVNSGTKFRSIKQRIVLVSTELYNVFVFYALKPFECQSHLRCAIQFSETKIEFFFDSDSFRNKCFQLIFEHFDLCILKLPIINKLLT